MKQYIMMNKENNRVIINSDLHNNHLSGELGNTRVHDFKPILFNKSFKNVIKSWWLDAELIPVKFILLDSDWVENLFTEYEWLYLKGSGKVYKVYPYPSKEVTFNPFVNRFSLDGKVYIKGVGKLSYGNFLVFQF